MKITALTALPSEGGRVYALPVTLATRRRSYWLLFILSVLVLSVAIAISMPLYGKGFDAGALGLMGQSMVWTAFGIHIESWRLAASGALILSAFASAVLFAILISFRKTASEEIYFLAFWAISCSFESGRLLVARFIEAGAPPLWSVVITRIVLAARFSGYGAFFLAGLRSAGFRSERPGRALLAAIGIGLAAAWTLPVDSGAFEATFLARASYPVERQIFVLVLALVSAANLLVAVESSGERVFRTVALGSVFLLAGQSLFVTGWRPETLVAGLALLAVGARLVVTRLHTLYLWQ